MESSNNDKTSKVSDREFEEKLVLAVSQFECIYNKTDSRFGCKVRNDSAWLKVARTVQRPIAECVDRWHLLFQIFLHFSRLETKYGQDWCCSQWHHYESFKRIQTKLAQSYTELLTMKAVSKKSSPRESAERWLLIQQIEMAKCELMERTTSCMRRQELWTDIATCLNEKFPIPQRCVIGWQMIWWELKQQLLSLLDTKDHKFSKEQLHVFSIHGITSATDADAKEKFSKAYEFGENVSDSICINCPSSTECDLSEGICKGCVKKRSRMNCQICLKNKGSCSLTLTAWREMARKLIPKSLRFKEAITICSRCHISLKLRGARQWRACRVCGESNHPLENLMNPSYTRLKRIFHTAIGCTFSLADGLPCFICIKCHGEFVEFIRFYVSFSNTQAKLQKIHEKSLIGDDWPNPAKYYAAEEQPQRHSKRHQSQTEIDIYIATNDKSLESNESSNETLLNLSDDSFDEASETLAENTKASPVDVPSSAYPVTLVKRNCNKRSRSQSPAVKKPGKTNKNLRKEASSTDGNSDLAKVCNAKQTGRTRTISLRRKTINISELNNEELDDIDNSNTDSISKSEPTISMDCDSNETKLRASDRSSSLSNSYTETGTEIASFADSSNASVDSRDSPTTHKPELGKKLSPDVEILKTSKTQNQSQPSSIPAKTTSNIICKQPSTNQRLPDQEKIVREFELSKEPTVIVIDIQTDPMENVKPAQAQSSKVQIVDLRNSESEYNEGLRNHILHTTTSTLAEKTNKVHDIVSSGRMSSDLDTNFLKSEEVSLIRLVDKSVMSSTKPITASTKSPEQSTTSPSKLSITVIGSSEKSEMPELKPITRVTRYSDQSSSKPSTRVKTTAELPTSKPRTRATRSLGQPETSPTKPRTRFTRSSLQSAMASLQPTRVTRSSRQSPALCLKPITTMPKKNKKLLGDLLMKCILDEPVEPAKKIHLSLKKEKEPLNDELPDPILDKPTKPEEAETMEVDHNAIEPIETEDNIQEIKKNSDSTTSSKNTSPEPGIILVGDDSSSNDTSTSQLGKESIEKKSAHCMFLPDVVKSTEMRLHTDIALHETLLPDDDDDYDIIGEAEVCQKQTTGVGHLQQSSLIDRVVERSFRTDSCFLQIGDVYSLNVSSVDDQDEKSD